MNRLNFLSVSPSFIGFRRRVREFFGASFWLLRPSLAWCFPVREPCFGLPWLPCLVFGVCVGHVVFSFFAKVSGDTLGSFSVLLCHLRFQTTR